MEQPPIGVSLRRSGQPDGHSSQWEPPAPSTGAQSADKRTPVSSHQGVRDISRHVEGKGHRAKEQALKSASNVAQFYTPATSVGGMSVQEAKVNSTGKPKGWCQYLMNCKLLVILPRKLI